MTAIAPPDLIDYRNARWETLPRENVRANLVICDPVYNDPDLSWVTAAAECLAPGGALWAFADASGVAQTKLALDEVLHFQNWCIWPNDWGGRPRDRFGQKHDDILYYIKPVSRLVKGHTFNASEIAIPKKMIGQTFNPSGRTTKIPTALWDDLAGFSTTAAERVRINGVGARWQKPEKLIERILSSCSNPGDFVADFFGGVATVPVVCARMNRQCVSTEIDPVVYAAGQVRLRNALALLNSPSR